MECFRRAEACRIYASHLLHSVSRPCWVGRFFLDKNIYTKNNSIGSSSVSARAPFAEPPLVLYYTTTSGRPETCRSPMGPMTHHSRRHHRVFVFVSTRVSWQPTDARERMPVGRRNGPSTVLLLCDRTPWLSVIIDPALHCTLWCFCSPQSSHKAETHALHIAVLSFCSQWPPHPRAEPLPISAAATSVVCGVLKHWVHRSPPCSSISRFASLSARACSGMRLQTATATPYQCRYATGFSELRTKSRSLI